MTLAYYYYFNLVKHVVESPEKRERSSYSGRLKASIYEEKNGERGGRDN